MLCAVGCGGKAVDPKAKKEKPPEIRKLNTSEGSALMRSESADRSIIWSINWKNAHISYEGDQKISGSMRDVSGEMYEHGEVASSFVADRALADKGKNLLVLSGNITATSKRFRARLECDKLEWDADKELIRARGNVKFIGSKYRAGTFDELWASPDLNQIGTPDLYDEVNKK